MSNEDLNRCREMLKAEHTTAIKRERELVRLVDGIRALLPDCTDKKMVGALLHLIETYRESGPLTVTTQPPLW